MSIQIEYVQTPQDDLAQIEQIIREYSSPPAKGLAHGVQKDAIQNGFGARMKQKEVDAFQEWLFTFELMKIHGKEALVFWDEGTHGLTGDIISSEEITARIGRHELDDPEQRLGRFLSRFSSGGNLGPGMFGRGKLVFHGASNTSSILVDSFRANDGLYIAFDRRVRSSMLMQPKIPHTGTEARNFIIKETAGIIEPLSKPGTRIIILDLKKEVADAIKYSFTDSSTAQAASLARMIEETWWEIILKFDAKICIKWGDKTKYIELTDPISAIVNARNNVDGARVHEVNNITLTAAGQNHRIKKIKLVVLPSALQEDYNEIWVQRKRMKIGPISRNIDANHKIAKKLAGYVILEQSIEELIESAENPTHYSLDSRSVGVRHIREIIRSQLQEFERQLGLVSTTEDVESQQRLLNAMKTLNDLAPELGLVTQQSIGSDRVDADISIKEFVLPDPTSLRVEQGDKIGPITYSIRNNRSTAILGTFQVITKQREHEPIELYRCTLNLDTDKSEEICLDPFDLDPLLYENAKIIDIEASYFETGSRKDLAISTRRIYLGLEPPDIPMSPVQLSVKCKFPHPDTRRVEMTDRITGIKVAITNTTAHSLFIDVKASVRHIENRSTGRLTSPLLSLLDESDLELRGQADKTFLVDDFSITLDDFASVHETIASISERTCDIFTVVTLARASKELDKPRRYKLNKASIPFYLEVDPPGHSIFQSVEQANEPSNGKQSWYEGDSDIGYKFVLNVGHNAYKFVQNHGETPNVISYEQEQMLRQAYRIAFANGVYKGPAEEYKDSLVDSCLTAKEISEIFDAIIGTALNEMRR